MFGHVSQLDRYPVTFVQERAAFDPAQMDQQSSIQPCGPHLRSKGRVRAVWDSRSAFGNVNAGLANRHIAPPGRTTPRVLKRFDIADLFILKLFPFALWCRGLQPTASCAAL